MLRFEFDKDKAVEVLLYIASRTSGDMYVVLKLLYLADKFHLENYGSLVCGDRYAALQYGPVPSSTYDLVKAVRNGVLPNAPFSIEQNTITPKRDANLEYLSRSDIKALDDAISKYSSLSFGALKNLTHDNAYHATNSNDLIALDAIASTLPNAAELIQHLSDRPASVKKA